jgi:biotin carboxyl carrier protein
MKYTVTVDGRTFEIEVVEDGKVWVDGQPYVVDLHSGDSPPHYSLLLGRRSYDAHIEPVNDEEWSVSLQGQAYTARVQQRGQAVPELPHHASGPDSSEGRVTSPLPGLVVDVAADVGQPVQAGDILLVLESMKMQIEVRAPSAGTVSELRAEPGQEVGAGQLLMTLR